MHKAAKQELLRTLTYRPDERIKTLRSLSIPEQSAAFSALSPYVQQSVLKGLRIHEIVNILDHMDLQQSQRVLARVQSAKKRNAIVQRLKGDVKEKMEYFLRFHPKATLALINFNYLFLDADLTVGQAGELIEEYYEETDRYPEILVHDQGTLLGEVQFSSLVRERNSRVLRKFVHELPVITYQAEVKEVVEVLTHSRSRKIVVLDHDTSVLGLIYADAVKSLFGDLPAESLYDFAGVDDSERPFDPVRKKVTNRYRWLILNLGTSFLAGFVVLTFQGTLDELVIMSIYIPIVAGMGGNAATQTFAVMVRGLTLGTISLQTAGSAIVKEGIAGIINGLIIGIIVTLISWLWNGDPMFGVVAGTALVGVHIIAALAGTVIPLLMKHLGKDPAATSTIFITTLTDVSGLFFLLGLATWVLL
jgi:magnesium transporter